MLPFARENADVLAWNITKKRYRDIEIEHVRDIERFWLVLLPPLFVCVGLTPLCPSQKPHKLLGRFQPVHPRTSSQRLGEHGKRSDLSHGYGLCDDFSSLVQGGVAEQLWLSWSKWQGKFVEALNKNTLRENVKWGRKESWRYWEQ